MKKIWVVLMCLFVIVQTSEAQEVYRSSGKPKYNTRNKRKRNEDDSWQRMVTGGGFTFTFGQDQYQRSVFGIGLSPVIGYRITDKIAVGVGLGYQYYKIDNYFSVGNDYYDLKANFISPSVWARFIIYRSFFAHAEFERNYMTYKLPAWDPSGSGNIIYGKERYTASCALIGPGFRNAIGEKASLNFMLLLDVLQDKYSPYGKDPFVKIQFLLGF